MSEFGKVRIGFCKRTNDPASTIIARAIEEMGLDVCYLGRASAVEHIAPAVEKYGVRAIITSAGWQKQAEYYAAIRADLSKAGLDSVKIFGTAKYNAGPEQVGELESAGLVTKIFRPQDAQRIGILELAKMIAGSASAVIVDARNQTETRLDPKVHSPTAWIAKAKATSLGAFFYPRNIAIIGASKREGSPGFTASDAITSSFWGRIYPVNPRGGEMFGLPVFKTVLDVPGDIDFALFVIPASAAVGTVKQLVQKNAKAAVVASGGFAEIDDVGEKEQLEMVEIAKESGLRLIGPNCLGIFGPSEGMDTIFCPRDKVDRSGPGPVSLFTQSGGIGLTLLNEISNIFGPGFPSLGKMMSIGNCADINELDCLWFCEKDPETQQIWTYLEGFHNGREFLVDARRIGVKKPIFVMRGGTTEAGAGAISSHSASLATSDVLVSSLLDNAGAIPMQRWQDFISIGMSINFAPLPKGDRVVIITNAGGPGVLAADALCSYGLQATELGPESQAKLRKVIPPFMVIGPIIDLTGSGLNEHFEACLQACMDDPNVDAVLFIGGLITPPVDPDDLADRVIKVVQRSTGSKPVVVQQYGGRRALAANYTKKLVKAGIPVVASETGCAIILRAMVDRMRFIEREKEERGVVCPLQIKRLGLKADPLDRDPKIVAVLESHRGKKAVAESDAKKIFDLAGIRTPASQLAQNPDEAVAAFLELGGKPVVMKLVSDVIIHKTEAGAVAVGLRTEEAVRAKAADFCARFRDQGFLGLLISELIPEGIEMTMGVTLDQTFGKIFVAGIGGILVEVLRDVRFALCPTHVTDVDFMLGKLKHQEYLNGFRGMPPLDRKAFAEMASRVSSFAAAYPEIREIDLNPVICTSVGLFAVDTRILLAEY